MSKESPILGPSITDQVDELLRNGADDIFHTVMDEVQRQVIQQVVQYSKGNLSNASRRLGVSRMTLRTKLKDHAKSTIERDKIPLPIKAEITETRPFRD